MGEKIDNRSILDNVPEKRIEERDDFDEVDESDVPWSDSIPIMIQKTREVIKDVSEGGFSSNLSEYKEERIKFIDWAIKEGKNPEKKMGYAESTMEPRSYRVDRFYRFVWEFEGEFTTDLKLRHAKKYVELISQADSSRNHKCECFKAVRTLYKWLSCERGLEEFGMENPFSSSRTSSPPDVLSLKEYQKVRKAAHEYGRIPTSDLSDEEIDERKTELSQRFGVKKDELCIDDLRSWKVPSMVEVSLEAGLRPCEVKEARTGWIDHSNQMLKIPIDESSKNRNYWSVVLTDKAYDTLSKWLEERGEDETYDGTDRIWLTGDENPFESKSLRDKIRRLFEVAGIDKNSRKVSWYIFRHTVGTYASESGNLEHARVQLRHRSEDTTKRYAHPPSESRKKVMEEIREKAEEAVA
jgi:integrase